MANTSVLLRCPSCDRGTNNPDLCKRCLVVVDASHNVMKPSARRWINANRRRAAFA